MTDGEKKRQVLARMDRQYETMELICYSETAELCYLGLPEAEADRAIALLDRGVDLITDLLLTAPAVVELGREPVRLEDFRKRLAELNEFTVFLVVRKLLDRWDGVKDPDSYLLRMLYLASRQHRQEAYFLRRSLENGSFGYGVREDLC